MYDSTDIHLQFLCSLGCGIGYGYLHRIPERDDSVPLQPPLMSNVASSGFSEVCNLCNIYHNAFLSNKSEVLEIGWKYLMEFGRLMKLVEQLFLVGSEKNIVGCNLSHRG